jgi:hypothetical protein
MPPRSDRRASAGVVPASVMVTAAVEAERHSPETLPRGTSSPVAGMDVGTEEPALALALEVVARLATDSVLVTHRPPPSARGRG